MGHPTSGAGDRAPRRRRLPPEERRREILAVATRVLGEHGVENVQVKEVARLAGVSRPLVYRFFPTRRDLFSAMLEDFVRELAGRFEEALARTRADALADITRAFVEACCDAIEAKGAGPWHLLDARGVSDPEVAELGLESLRRLLAPWHEPIAETTGLSRDQVRLVARVVVAAGRAALDEWLEGRRSRERAAGDASRAVTALLEAFAEQA